MAKPSEWATKLLALLRAGNPGAAIAQIKVAPNVKDLKALQAALAALAASPFAGRWRDVDAAIEDNISALSAPRLHRSP